MDAKFAGPDDPKIVDAVLERMDGLTREEILARLLWTPSGLEHEGYNPPAGQKGLRVVTSRKKAARVPRAVATAPMSVAVATVPDALQDRK